MIKKALLSFFFLVSASFAFGQSAPAYELILTKRASAIQEEISYTLQRDDEGGILILKEKIFPEKGSSADSLYISEVLKKPADEQKNLLREFVESKISFVSHSQVIKDQEALKGIDLLVIQWAKLVEQSQLKTPNRMVLDGTSFSFSLQVENQETTSFSIHSPDDQTHPEIIRLLYSIESLSKHL